MTIEPMTDADFAELAEWRYEPPYDFYDGDVEPVLNPERFYVVRDDSGELVGFYYFDEQPEGTLEFGLGLRPDLTGRGRGAEFFRTGLEFGRKRFSATRVLLHVAAFNERAIKVYERCGFHAVGTHMRSFEQFGEVEFVTMEEGDA